MKLNFRQGLVRFQTDTNNNPTFLQLNPAGVTLNVSPDHTIVTLSHGETNYLFEEHQTIVNAWPGPFEQVDQWLYWDIDIVSGERTFGITKIKPTASNKKPHNPANDTHWFDLQSKEMKVYTSNNHGGRFIPKIRVFAALLDEGGVLVPYNIGSQVGLNDSNHSGVILFDDDSKPVKKFNRFGTGKFITSETPLSSQFSRLINFKLENELNDAKADEYIPKFSCVALKTVNKINLASHLQPDYPCIGISSEDMYIGEARNFITSGFIKNDSWDWNEAPGTILFVGETGEITTDVPQSFSLQSIGHIVSKNTIFVDIKQIIKLV